MKCYPSAVTIVHA
jgi:hypothetical protein